jgi:Zn-dependent M28 family amino/carboxypeptidase
MLLARLLPLCLVLAGCASVSRPEVGARIAEIEEARVRAHVRALADIGPRPAGDAEAARRTLAYIDGQLRALGLEPEEERFVATVFVPEEAEAVVYLTTGERELRNLLVELPGVTEPDVILEIGAHYDTVHGTVGADDNASGVAGLLEIARALAGARHERTLRLCFFAGEENGPSGGLRGSGAHVERILDEEARREHHGILVLEMIGYATDEPDTQATPVRIPLVLWPPDQGNFIAVVGNMASGGLGNRFEDAAERYVPELPYYSLNRLGGFLSDAARSDHFRYWEAGLPGVMLTDTSNFRNPHYHDPSDTPDTLNYAFLRDVARATAATALEWAGPLPPDDAGDGSAR